MGELCNTIRAQSAFYCFKVGNLSLVIILAAMLGIQKLLRKLLKVKSVVKIHLDIYVNR